MSLIFLDCEANGPSPNTGSLTEFGAVEFDSRLAFHGIVHHVKAEARSDEMFMPMTTVVVDYRNIGNVYVGFYQWLEQFPSPLIFVSDNPAYDWQWINDGFHIYLRRNPFGHSARRIGDFYAGLVGDWRAASKWKKFRKTQHDHNPVHDAMGNVEAFAEILRRYPWARQKFGERVE